MHFFHAFAETGAYCLQRSIAFLRVYLKPVGPAPLCQLIAGGDINPIPSTTEALQELFNETVGPTDLVFRNASWIAEWRYAQVNTRGFLVVVTIDPIDLRANIRMADRFMKNRVFLVGGKALSA